MEWTIGDIRHDLARELRRLRRQSRRRSPEPNREYFSAIIDYVRELGHNLYERPERIRPHERYVLSRPRGR